LGKTTANKETIGQIFFSFVKENQHAFNFATSSILLKLKMLVFANSSNQ